jgi:aspartyl-tRNA(Asn)/glutamyl-tRNA(Gln) amidotransferase subunit A
MSEAELALASIKEVAKLIRREKVSPVELTKLMLARIERLNPKLNAYLTVCGDEALAQARKAEAELFGARGGKGRRDRGPLHGIPVSLKDNIYTAGIRTTAGSKILRDFVPRADARVVKRLRSAGAVFLGKTNLHEFAYGVTTNNPHYGPTRNPWDPERIPGGSSGGSAAALAVGLSYASVGTDTGGSIRIPAALCGVVGFKPTFAAVSCEGVVPLSPTLDHVGPLARTVKDAALVLNAISETNKARAGAFPRKSSALRNLRLGRPQELFFDVLSDEVRAAFEQAIRVLEKLGARIVDISIPLIAESEDAGNQIAWAEATHYHQQAGYFPARAAEYSDDVRKRLEMGAQVSATAYLRALDMRRKFQSEFAGALAQAGVRAVVVPTTPITAPRIGEEKTRIGAPELPTRALLLRLNRPANLAGVPAISVPCGFSPNGLPIGLQIIGGEWSDSRVIEIAAAFEESGPAQQKRSPEVS